MVAVTTPRDETTVADLLNQPDLSVSEVAKVTKLTRTAIYDMIKRGDLKEGSSHTMRWGKRIKTDSVLAFMRATKREIPKK